LHEYLFWKRVPYIPHAAWVEVCKAPEEGAFEVRLEVRLGQPVEEGKVS
jgi:hypothetical protein